MELTFQPLQFGEVPGVGDYQFDLPIRGENRGAGDQHLLTQFQDGGHRVDPLPRAEHLLRDRALIQQPFDLRHSPAQYLIRTDAGGAGIGAVDKEDAPLAVGDMNAVVEVLAHLQEVQPAIWGRAAASAVHIHRSFPMEALIKCACGASRIFFATTSLRFLEINTMIPVKSRLAVAKNLSRIALVDLISPSPYLAIYKL